MCTCGIQKDGTDESVCREAVEMQTENRLMVMWGAGEESGMNGERNMETYTLVHIKQPMGISYLTQRTQPGAL